LPPPKLPFPLVVLHKQRHRPVRRRATSPVLLFSVQTGLLGLSSTATLRPRAQPHVQRRDDPSNHRLNRRLGRRPRCGGGHGHATASAATAMSGALRGRAQGCGRGGAGSGAGTKFSLAGWNSRPTASAFSKSSSLLLPRPVVTVSCGVAWDAVPEP
jgi:hypothetical protein